MDEQEDQKKAKRKPRKVVGKKDSVLSEKKSDRLQGRKTKTTTPGKAKRKTKKNPVNDQELSLQETSANASGELEPRDSGKADHHTSWSEEDYQPSEDASLNVVQASSGSDYNETRDAGTEEEDDIDEDEYGDHGKDSRNERGQDSVEQYGETHSPKERSRWGPLPELSYPLPPLSARMLIGIAGTEISSSMRKLLEQYPVAGVIIFSRNYQSPAQLAEMINELQEISLAHPWKRPMLIAVDHEGTTVTRFSEPVTIFPDAASYGKHNSRTLMFETAQIVARQLRAMGINMNLAPVVDLNTNKKNPIIGKRSFHSDPEVVSKMMAAYVKAFQRNDMLTCLKHFPGHGNTDVDSHLDLPVLKENIQRLKSQEMLPFIRGIQQSCPAIMTGHLVFPDIDPDPVTLSKNWISFLREDLGFDGLVLSDDLEMGAIVKSRTPLEACVLAFEAGIDVGLINQEKTALQLLPELAKVECSIGEHTRSLQRLERVLAPIKLRYSPVYIPDVTRVFHKDHTLIIRAAQDTTGKFLAEWRAVRDLPPHRRPAPVAVDQRYLQYEEMERDRVQLTAPGGRLVEEGISQSVMNAIRKPHKEALSVVQDAYVRAQMERLNPKKSGKNSKKNGRRPAGGGRTHGGRRRDGRN